VTISVLKLNLAWRNSTDIYWVGMEWVLFEYEHVESWSHGLKCIDLVMGAYFFASEPWMDL